MKENKSVECTQNNLKVDSDIYCENNCNFTDKDNFKNEKGQHPDPCNNNNYSLTVENNCNETFKKPILPFCQYSQSNNVLLINIKCEIHKISSFHIEIIDSKTFKFHYKYLDNGFVPVTYGCSFCTAPYAFKTKGVFHEFSNDSLIIKVQKKKAAFWPKIKMGVEQRKMKEMVFQGTKLNEDDTSQGNEFSSFESHSGNQEEHPIVKSSFQNGTGSLEKPSVTNKENLIKQSTGELDEMKIPKFIRRINGYFVTKSWPQGILKVRSHSLRESTIAFKSHSLPTTEGYSTAFDSSLNCKDVDGETGEGNQVESSITKKSVHFNDFVYQQVFRVDGSILGQKAKNQKKALQRKRAKERKLSKCQSSWNSISIWHSDLSTTQQDSSTKVEGVKQKEISKPKKKKRTNKKPSLNISNQILIEMD